MLLTKLFIALCRKYSNKLHSAEAIGHHVYLGSVWFFAHGPYSWAAGGLLIVSLLVLLADPD